MARLLLPALLVFGFVAAQPLHAQDSEEEPADEMLDEALEEGDEPMPTTVELPGLKWTEGPAKFPIGSIAQLALAKGYHATGAAGTSILMRAMGNPTSPNELATVMPSEGFDWFATFDFENCGYVPDDEKDDLDADSILAALRVGNEKANRYRLSQGQPILTIVGWHKKPHYNLATHNLEWAIKATSVDGPVINYNVRMLGRSGVMSANLVVEPQLLEQTLATFRQMLGGFSYTTGNSYGEYRKGDRIAEYGLKGLIAGGAIAVAAKSGLLGKLWKFIVIGAVAIAGFFRKLFGGKGARERPRRRGGGAAGTA